MFVAGISEKIVFALVQAFTLFTHSYDSNGTLAEVARLTHTCPAFFSSCGDWYFLPGVDLPVTHVWYGVLIALTLLSVVYVARSAYASTLLVPGYLWIAILVCVLAYDAGHASDYLFLVIGVIVFLSKENFSVYFDRVMGTLYACGGILTLALWTSSFPMYGFTPFVTPAVSDALALAVSVAAVYVGVQMCRGIASRDEYWFLILVHIGAGVLFELVYALTITPFLLMRVLQDRDVSKASSSIVVGIVCVTVFAHGYMWFVTTHKGRVCQRTHIGITTAYNVVSCESALTVQSADGEKVVSYAWDGSRPCRCDYYTRWFEAQQWCKKNGVTAVAWDFSRTTLRGVTEELNYPDACSVPFSFLSTGSVYPHR